ncbi:MAG TPA: hypothetical protein VGD66_00390 [Allosphingosinicella sp.]|jgi:hypothetical protein
MRIAICVPHEGVVKARFAECLAMLIGYTASLRINYNDAVERAEITLIFEGRGPLEYKRSQCVRRSLEWGTDYLLFVDSDQSFPADALVRLMARDLPVIGCNYSTRQEPPRPTAYGFEVEPVYTTPAKAAASPVERVAGLGLGFCLVKAPVFDLIEHPLFRTIVNEKGELQQGEDVYFWNRVHQAGLAVHVDHELSLSIGHIGEKVFLNADAVPGDG